MSAPTAIAAVTSTEGAGSIDAGFAIRGWPASRQDALRRPRAGRGTDLGDSILNTIVFLFPNPNE
jgi:hypothetical protein